MARGVSEKKFVYDIWGDAVNVASRIESSSELGRVNISEETYQSVKDRFICSHGGEVATKNKGQIAMYFVESAVEVPTWPLSYSTNYHSLKKPKGNNAYSLLPFGLSKVGGYHLKLVL